MVTMSRRSAILAATALGLASRLRGLTLPESIAERTIPRTGERLSVVGLGTAPVSSGRFLTTVRIPSTARAGAAAIRACYTGGCAFATINVA